MKKLFLVLLLVGSLVAEDIFYEDDVEVTEAFEMMKKGALLIDVRTAGEFIYAGHPLGAVSIPVFEYSYKPKPITLRVKFAQKEKEKPLDAHKIYDLIPVENNQFIEDVKEAIKLTKPKAILVICRSGSRSEYAANLLAKNGLQEVYNVEGGVLEWKREKLPFGGN
ncbi:MAG: rhodanese-like domain-containing protein [Epsilonproteobacteria bacterium]|nr:rhodanese-like domain-containing protein [Campylobacterota bacterium]